MALYTMLQGSHSRWEGDKEAGRHVRYMTGDTIECTPEQAEGLGSRITLAIGENPWNFLTEMPWGQAVTFVRGLETVEEIQGALEAEEGSNNRASVLSAANSRLEELVEELSE